MIANFGRQAGSLKTITHRIKEKAKGEGFEEFEIGLLAREILKDIWTKDQLYRWFPTGVKHKPAVEDSSSTSSTKLPNDGKKDTDETFTDKGFISDKDKIPEDKFWKPPETKTETEQDITTNPAYQRLQQNYDLKIKESNYWQKKAEDLDNIVKKDAFKPATEVQGETYEITVDGINVEHFKSVKLESVLSTVVSSLRNRGWKQVEIWVRSIPQDKKDEQK